MSEDLWAAYAATLVDVTLPNGAIRRVSQTPNVGGDTWPFDVPLAWIMTACNPRSELLDEAANIVRHRELGEELAAAGALAIPNVGYDPGDPAWSEPGYTVPGADVDLIVELAHRWEQNAIFSWQPDRWEIIGVLLPGRSVGGWRWVA